MFDDNTAPIPKPDVDFSSLSAQPTPEQYFLLSRINGELTIAELCRISGLPKEETLAELEQLVNHGLIEMPGSDADEGPDEEEGEPAETGEPEQADRAAESEPDVQPGGAEASIVNETSSTAETRESSRAEGSDGTSDVSTDEGSSEADREHLGAEKTNAEPPPERKKKSKRKKRRDVTPNFPVPPSEFDFDQELLELDIPLDEEQRRQALCLYEQLDQMTFYDLFGVESDASRRDIKRAYFRLSKRYHPDKFFRKELHGFAEILERIFQEITKAYRTLSNRDKRSEYDQQLQASTQRSGNEPSPAAASSLAESSSRAFQDEENEEKKRKKNKKDAAALLLIRRAEKLVERDEYERAAGEYRKALALKREPSMAIEVARMLDSDGGQPEEAISFARAALKLDPRNVEARVLLSDLYEKTDRPEDALKYLEKAARLEPSNEDIQDKLDAMRTE